MRMLVVCFANVARSQVAEHISRCSHNMIAIIPVSLSII
jgi:protein-tyrosine-phosphatase